MFGFFKKDNALKELESKVISLTYMHELDRPEIRLQGEPTIVPKTIDAFNLGPPRKVEKHYGNTQYLDRVIIPVNISEGELQDVISSMIASFNHKYKYNRRFKSTFLSPGTNTPFRYSEIPNHVELRLYIGFETWLKY